MTVDAPAEALLAGQAAIRREAAGVLAVADQLGETFLRAVDLLADCTGKVFVTGSGTSGSVARRMAHLLSVCGTPALYMSPMDALHGSMGAIVGGDILIAISHGGETAELSDLAERVRRRDVPIVVLTSAPDSTLGRLADLAVVLADDDQADPGGVIAMGSTLAVSVWGDALAYVLMRRSGYGWDQVLETHPAGAVGKITELPAALPGLTAAADAGRRGTGTDDGEADAGAGGN
ncbi:SIS domain-containing protein [Solwaraspora sp. WMMD937]|uniref:KpsF/GutQ family sugar-phosphate isomerase n=1 Tax=Solwaraspora sp. WMMD937 TaxID=3016090 RepID=UPI00249CA091|nr:SIS domain-containing protein [Solwaraspora sp. WMMD937]WFE20731.1 SIS domain-containing protein [Solwaraspora sp. WMMD937]